MYTKQEIILRSYREGKSQRQISRELQLNRKTVRKYIEEYERLQDVEKEKESGYPTYLTTAPQYKMPNRQKVRLTEEIQATIDDLLSANKARIEAGLRKQTLKKIDILEVLHTQGHSIGYTTVCNYIREKTGKQTVKEAFVRQVYQPGEVCEFDWGEIKLDIGGELRRFQLAVFTSAYSNYRYAAIFQRQDTLAFMEAHASFFSHVQGVYHQMVYDNMRVAVSKFVGLHEKEPTRALLQLRGHYQFSHRFCNIYSGNEKGHVERSVEYVRRKAFGLKHNFSSLEEAMTHLESAVNRINQTKQQLTGRTSMEMFDEEKSRFHKFTQPLACFDSMELRVDKYATVSFCTNRYSVSDKLVGCFVELKAYSHKVDIFHQNKLIASHERSSGKHQWIISIEHYLDTFRQKPGALAGSAALASNPYLQKLYCEFYTDTPRDFIELLHYCRQNQVEQTRLESAVTQLKSLCTQTVTTEKITAMLGNKAPKEAFPIPEDNETAVLAQDHLSQLTILMNTQTANNETTERYKRADYALQQRTPLAGF